MRAGTHGTNKRLWGNSCILKGFGVGWYEGCELMWRVLVLDLELQSSFPMAIV